MKPTTEIENLDDDIGDLDFTIVQDSAVFKLGQVKDSRDYVDKIFQEYNLSGATNKPIRKINCLDNIEPDMLPGDIAVLTGYKKVKTRGRRVPLAGVDIIHIDTPTGPLRLPLNKIEKFAKYLLAISKSASKLIPSSINDDLETPSV